MMVESKNVKNNSQAHIEIDVTGITRMNVAVLCFLEGTHTCTCSHEEIGQTTITYDIWQVQWICICTGILYECIDLLLEKFFLIFGIDSLTAPIPRVWLDRSQTFFLRWLCCILTCCSCRGSTRRSIFVSRRDGRRLLLQEEGHRFFVFLLAGLQPGTL